MERVVAGITMCLAFLVMASIFVPEQSEAEEHGEPHTATPADPHAYSTDPHEGLTSLGSLDHRLYHVVIYATDGGPRYSVYDRASGEELRVLLTAEQVAEHFPEMPIPAMDIGTGQQLMLVLPDQP